MQLKRSHPEWSGEKLKEELSKISGSQKGPKGSQPVHKSSQNTEGSPNITPSRKDSQGVHRGSQEERRMVKLDHSIEKSQYIVSESLDGINWRYTGTLPKGRIFDPKGALVIVTWHKGSTKEGDAV